jgi:hypothetical protein
MLKSYANKVGIKQTKVQFSFYIISKVKNNQIECVVMEIKNSLLDCCNDYTFDPLHAFIVFKAKYAL